MSDVLTLAAILPVNPSGAALVGSTQGATAEIRKTVAVRAEFRQPKACLAASQAILQVNMDRAD
jgi:predicted CoA-binding protein